MKVFKKMLAGREIRVEIGEVAKQANASAMVYYGDSAVLSVVVAKENERAQDFFPLMVLYQEKLYAAGKIPGGFLRREGRPSEHETLTSRLIDRPLRPLFPDGYNDEVQIINTVLSSDPEITPEMVALFGSSLVTHISDIPFKLPVSGVLVGRVDEKFILNPTVDELSKSDLELNVAGTKEAINMVEAGAKEVSEDVMLEALMFAHEAIKDLCDFQDEIRAAVGVSKKEVTLNLIDPDILELVKKKLVVT